MFAMCDLRRAAKLPICPMTHPPNCRTLGLDPLAHLEKVRHAFGQAQLREQH